MICERCGHQKTVYYGEHCFRCDKPKGEVETVYNLISVLHYLDHKRSGLYDRVWDFLYQEDRIANDTLVRGLLYKDLINDVDVDNSELAEDLQLLFTEFPLAEESIWEISW